MRMWRVEATVAVRSCLETQRILQASHCVYFSCLPELGGDCTSKASGRSFFEDNKEYVASVVITDTELSIGSILNDNDRNQVTKSAPSFPNIQ